jgi:hypothetical protein
MRKRSSRNAPVNVPESVTVPVPVLVGHDRVRHAAHYMYNHPARGHDLDRWTVRAVVQPTSEQLSSLGMPSDAEWSTGYITPDTGTQHWIYLAKRPLSEGTCERCLPGVCTERSLS